MFLWFRSPSPHRKLSVAALLPWVPGGSIVSPYPQMFCSHTLRRSL